MFNTDVLPAQKGKQNQSKAGLGIFVSNSGCKGSNTWRTPTSPSSPQRNGPSSSATQDSRVREAEPLWYATRLSDKLVGTETIGNGEIILVDHGETGQDTDIGAKIKARGNIKKNVIDVAHQWKAQVHDTRALNENRVFILVSWLNRPSDLPTGPAPYHAKNELIPTNEVCIIDAMTVNGPLNVVHWDEYDDTAAPPEEDQYFWRQTYNYITKSLSVRKSRRTVGAGAKRERYRSCECCVWMNNHIILTGSWFNAATLHVDYGCTINV